MGSARAFVETIEIDVIELQASGVRVYERERWTSYIFFFNTQRRTDSLYENCLARSERTTEQKNLTAFKTRAYLVSVVERLLGR